MTAEIVDSIYVQCDNQGLLYDKNHLPIKVGPDCYMIHATPVTESCHKWGDCHEGIYYALTGGSAITLISREGKH